MNEPAQVENLINQRVQEAVTNVQSDMLKHMDRLISSSFDSFQGTMKENQRQLSETQLAKIEQLNSDNYVFKRKGNEEQFKTNAKVSNKMKEARAFLREDTETTELKEKALQSISEGLDIMTHRQKLVKLADQSDNGWRTVMEYETHSLADDSEDEKRIQRAESKAAKKMKNDKRGKFNRTTPYTIPQSTNTNNRVNTVNSNGYPIHRPGKCFECGVVGHWRSDHQSGSTVLRSKIDKISRKVDDNSFCISLINSNSTGCTKQTDPVHSNECVDGKVNISPVSRLRKAHDYWQSVIKANDYILNVLKEGYKIPFLTDPIECQLKNNKSSLEHVEFVEKEITKLENLNCIKEVHKLPKVVNPLTVAENKNKLRLVLDCRHINPHLHKFRFKYEDAVVASQMFEKGDHLFTYDLRSAYHHIEIFEDDKTYLDFCWYYKDEKKMRYFVFNCLPFGISTAGFIFTKVVRCVVKYLREQGLKVIMYLDDGIGGASDFGQASLASTTVQSVLKSAGFLIAEEKCNWIPSQKVTWLGLDWEINQGAVYVTNARILKLINTLAIVIDEINRKRAINYFG